MTEHYVPDTRIWWYLSFSSGEFEGAVFLAADSFQDAVEAAWTFGAKKEWSVLGGNVTGLPLPPESARERLLSLKDLLQIFGKGELVNIPRDRADLELTIEMVREVDA
jgi:hypothetical protein